MEIYQEKKEKLMKELGTSIHGRTKEQAKALLEEDGPNELVGNKKKSVWVLFGENFKDVLVIILMIAAIVSAFLDDLESAIVIFAVIILNGIIGTIQSKKSEKSLESLKKLSSPSAKVLREGQVKSIKSREVVVGDILLLEAGDYICADGRILENASLKIDESTLTGESLPVEKKDINIEKDEPLGNRLNMVYSGSYVTYGRGRILVTHIGMNTEVGKIAKLLKNTTSHKTPLQENLDRFGKKLAIIIISICILLFAMNVIRDQNIFNAFMFSVALAVAAIPEALSSIVTIVLVFGTQKMVEENAIVRKLQAVEGLGSVSIICSDKTGTLTMNKMTVIDLYIDQRFEKKEKYEGGDDVFDQLVSYGILCNDATFDQEKEIGDPTEIALIRDEKKQIDQVRNQFPRIDEIPFDSERKLMSTLHQKEKEYLMIVKGAVDQLLTKVTYIHTFNGIRKISKEDIENIKNANESCSQEGLRVLGFAYKTQNVEEIVEKDLVFLGLISMMDPPRKESKPAVEECFRAGIRPIMITGDHKITAAAIGKEIGILTPGKKVVEGAEIEDLTDSELRDFVEDVAVYARVTPSHKIRIVKAWQEKGKIVAMTGDGVNDAPALKQADIGVAMGITGTEVAKDAASMILTDDNFATIIKAIENGRNIYENIKKSIFFLLSGNMAAILSVVYASIFGLSMPFAPVHLLFINLLTDSLPAIALGLDPHKKSIMEKQPRRREESILTKDFLVMIGMEGFIIGVFTMLAYYIGLHVGGEGQASTMAFGTLCLSRLIHGFSCKSKESVLFKKEMWNNKYSIYALFVGLFLLNMVLIFSPLHKVFGVTNLNLEAFLCIYGLSLFSFLGIQGLKKVVQNRMKKIVQKSL